MLGATGPAGPSRQIQGAGDEFSPTLALNPGGEFAAGYIGQSEADDAVPALRVQSFRSFDPQNPPGPSSALQTPIPGTELRSPRLAILSSGRFAAVFTHAGDEVDTIYAAEYLDRSLSPGLAVVDAEPRADQFNDGKFVPTFDVDAFENSVVAYVERSTNSVRTRRLSTMVAELRGAELFVHGTERSDHIIVERVRANVFVNINGFVRRFNAADVEFLSISGLGGDNDIINSTALPATIHGGGGHDTIWGGAGSDRIRGFGGNDLLRAGDGNDIVFGDDGNDTLHGDNGRDTLRGGAGADASIAGEVTDAVPENVSIDASGVVTVEGTDQADAVSAWGDSQIVVVEVAGLTRSFPRDSVTLIDVRGREGGDTLVMNLLLPVPARLDGGAGGDLLRGGARGDVLLGGDGNDTIYGGRGEDRLAGGPGDDFHFGESGDDRLDADAPGGRDSFDGGTETDTLDYAARTNPVEIRLQWGVDGEAGEDDHGHNVEILIGGAGDDFIEPFGDVDSRPSVGFTIFGGAGDDTVRTGGANDVLFGEAGDDDIDGRGGSDHVEGGAGNDTIRSTDGTLQFNGFDSLFGSDGNDRFLTDDGVADRIRGGPGNDSADADPLDDVLAVEVIA